MPILINKEVDEYLDAHKVDINVASLKFSEVRHSQDTISFHKINRETQEKFTYDDIKESISKEGWKGEAVDVIKMPDRKLTSIDNCRVSAAKELGISIKANVRNYDEKLSSDIIYSERFLKRNGRNEVIENQSAHFRSKDSNGLLNTKEKLLMAICVSTAITADKLYMKVCNLQIP